MTRCVPCPPAGPYNIPLLGSWEFIRLWLTGGSLTEMYARLGERYGDVIFMRTVLDAPVVAIRRYDALKVTFCGGESEPESFTGAWVVV